MATSQRDDSTGARATTTAEAAGVTRPTTTGRARARDVCALQRLELLRGRLVEVEAMASAASATLARLPYVPWPEDLNDQSDVQARLCYERIPYLVSATAEAACQALLQCVADLRELE